jgi:muramoyltetrapeptide carboxypeptidase
VIVVHFPSPLKPGAVIGIVSPGSAGPRDVIIKGRRILEKRGYKVVVHPQNYLRDGQLAGSDKKRAAAIMDMFEDPAIDAIMCARGGNGSIRVLDKLDYKRIGRHPKPFIGFSDITVFLQAIRRKCGFVTYHGPMLVSLAGTSDPRTIGDLFRVIEAGKHGLTMRFPRVVGARPGTAEGELVGGNLTLLQTLIGTPYEWPDKDIILFIEDVDEVLYRIDRMLNHLRLAGKLKKLRAILIGDMVNVPDGESSFMRKGERPYGRSLQEIVRDNVPPHIPVGIGFPCGHGRYLTTLPIGARVKVEIDRRGTKLSF